MSGRPGGMTKTDLNYEKKTEERMGRGYRRHCVIPHSQRNLRVFDFMEGGEE